MDGFFLSGEKLQGVEISSGQEIRRGLAEVERRRRRRRRQRRYRHRHSRWIRIPDYLNWPSAKCVIFLQMFGIFLQMLGILKSSAIN